MRMTCLILMLKKLSLNFSGLLLKIQTKYRPILEVFLKKSVLPTKIIFTDHCVITALAISKFVLAKMYVNNV